MCLLETLELGAGSAFDVAHFLSSLEKNSSTFLIKNRAFLNVTLQKKMFSKNTQEKRYELSVHSSC